MKRVNSNGEWSLFCPNEAPGLSDFWGEEFEELYTRYEREQDCLKGAGSALTTAVTIVEILKKKGLAIEKRILMSTVDMKDESKGRLIPKAKIEVLLGKTEKFNDLMVAVAAKGEAVGDNKA